MFSWHTLGALKPTISEIYLSDIVTVRIWPFVAIIYPSFNGYFQLNNAPCHKAQVVSNSLDEHASQFNVLCRMGDLQNECASDKSAGEM